LQHDAQIYRPLDTIVTGMTLHFAAAVW